MIRLDARKRPLKWKVTKVKEPKIVKVKEVLIMCKQKRPPESVNERGPYKYEVKEALETKSERGPIKKDDPPASSFAGLTTLKCV